MRTYTIYMRTFQGIRNVDNRNKLDEIHDTGWKEYATVVGAKELLNTLLNSRYKRLYAREWCERHYVYHKEDIDVSEDDLLYSYSGTFNVYSVIDDRGHEVDLMNIIKSSPRHQKKVYKFRCDSVPGISKGQWKFAHYYRKFPKPKKNAKDAIDEVREYTRNYKIKDHTIPDTWDDIVRSDAGDRSWKRHRDNQFKRSRPSYRSLKTDVDEDIWEED